MRLSNKRNLRVFVHRAVFVTITYGKNEFAKVPKNLRHISKNDFIELSKLLYEILKCNEKCYKNSNILATYNLSVL